ncbi:jmjC domain-containing protein 4 isoform X2 [Durio zibethinus]|uniref:JmjC domain-containing protein 4 isoform X2 n=1 Tax=Durio zibethinus TaxID=66656 RepID=A0A6P5YDR0_DURZI|nr:jmjC domain-containing protein 4 isoform X2 [Durio zibethinus]
MGVKIGGQIEKVNGRELSYTEFAERYLAQNQPVVLTGLMDDWKASKEWVFTHGQPNLYFFSTHFSKSKVQVADCGTRAFSDQKRLEMSVLEFVNHWLLQGSGDNFDGNGQSVLYLKDWHFVKEYPEYQAYRTPPFFTDDWLNLYLDNYRMHDDPDSCQENNDLCCSDYRFVYMGAKGSWTPLHADVFRSYSWSANVCGKKKWLLLPPLQCNLLFDRNMKSSVYNIFDDISETKFPGFKKAIWLECIQEQNEIIFVPSGWYHQVHNLEDTISINHNWFNAYNLSWVWDLLLRDYKEAKEYIEDIKDICDDFEGLCQRNLAANSGMNFNDFFIFISRFSLANVLELYYLRGESNSESWHWSATVQHFALNLASIRKIALKMKSEGGVQGNLGIHNLMESLGDPTFLKLSTDLGRIYAVIHEQEKWSCTKKILMADIEKHGSQISTCC